MSPCVGKNEYNVEPEAQREPTHVMQNTAERGERERKKESRRFVTPKGNPELNFRK